MNTQGEPIIENRWSSTATAVMSDLDLLVYQSRILGADSRLVLWGGGNTSLKVRETDFRGSDVEVLRIKGSGSDLKAVTARDFPGVRMDDALTLISRDSMSDEAMIEYLLHALMEPGAVRPSIETLLHAFVPARSVVHSHADAILALTNNERCDELLAEVFGDELAVIPYRRPGFILSKQLGLAARERPEIKGVILSNHGLVTWDDDPQEAYSIHISMVDRAARYAKDHHKASFGTGAGVTHGAPRPVPVDTDPLALPPGPQAVAVKLAPYLRGLLGREQRVVVHFNASEEVQRFVSGMAVPFDRLGDVVEAGAATPDHILNMKRTPLWVEADDPNDHVALQIAVAAAYTRWVEAYEAYYAGHNSGEAMLSPLPRVVLVRDVGLFSIGKDRRAAQIAGDIARHWMQIVEAAESVGRYSSLSPQDTFAAEYWPIELYKLTIAPPEKELSRLIVLLTGAAGAIGSAVARTLAASGAHVVCADLAVESVGALADELEKSNPSNPALTVYMDVTSEVSVRRAYASAILEYGGVDIVVSNAGIAKSAPLDVLTLDDWNRSLAVNATGHFLVASEGLRVMKVQGTGGSMVFVATKNVTAPGKDFGAYSASKAAEAQLARVLALEGGPHGIRSNIVNPDAIFAGSGLWSSEVREQRARAQGIAPSDIEEFYRKRNLLQAEVTADDVAQAVLFYASGRSAKTTGSMLPVDGGLREAFPR